MPSAPSSKSSSSIVPGMTWSFPMYGRVGPGQESRPPEVEQPTSVSAMASARSAESCMLILPHRPRARVLEPGEVLEEREIDLVDRPPLNWRHLPKDCGSG